MDSSDSDSGGSTMNNPPPPRKRHRSNTPKDVEDTDNVAVQSLPPRKRHKSYTTADDDEKEVMVQLMPPRKRHQSHISTAKDDANNAIVIQSISKEKDDDDDDAASKTITTWKKLHEISLLKGILEYYKENRTYPFDDTNGGMQKFYKDWIEKGGVYVEEDAFNDKMVELAERFFMNQERVYRLEMIQGWKDPLQGKIFDLSHMIWGRDNHHDDDNEGGPSAS